MARPDANEGLGGDLRDVARLHFQLQRATAAGCGGTTTTQCFIIGELGRSGELTLAALSRRLGLDKGWTSRAVEALVEEGLVAKETGTEDRRTIRITLTPAGRARFRALNRALDDQAARVMARVPATQQQTVAAALRLLRDALEEEALCVEPAASR